MWLLNPYHAFSLFDHLVHLSYELIKLRHHLLISFSSNRTKLKDISISDEDAWWLDQAWVLPSTTWVFNETLDLIFNASLILVTSLLILCVVLVKLSSRDCNLQTIFFKNSLKVDLKSPRNNRNKLHYNHVMLIITMILLKTW